MGSILSIACIAKLMIFSSCPIDSVLLYVV